MKRNILFFSFSCLLLFLLTSCAYTPEDLFQTDENMGNSIGNLWQMGTVAQDKENLYYMSFEDNKSYLVKSDLEGNDKEIISNTPCININIVGEWIYYINSDDNKTYKMDKQGGQIQKVSDINMRFLVVYKDTLYGICISDEDNNHIYSMDTSGENIKDLSNEKVSDFCLIGDFIYYTAYNRDVNKCFMYSVDLNSMEKEEVFNYEDDIPWFHIYENRIYFLTDMRYLSYIDITDNNKVVKVNDKLIFTNRINAKENLIIYYDSKSDIVYAYDINKNEEKEVKHGDIPYIHLIENQIFYYMDDELFSIKIDGSNEKTWGV